jgi:hypothetical protein
MKHSEHAYIDAGYRYGRGKTAADVLRLMIESEDIEDRTEARRLIDIGRHEAQKSNKWQRGNK